MGRGQCKWYTIPGTEPKCNDLSESLDIDFPPMASKKKIFFFFIFF